MGRRPYTAEQKRAAFFARTMPEPTTGCLLWLGKLTKPGATLRNPGGYGKVYGHTSNLAHRAAWELEHGPIPEGMGLDHQCRTPAYVNVEHLRLCTASQNAANTRSRKGSVSRFKGVSPERGRWKAQLQASGRHVFLGRHETEEEAARAYNHGAREHFGDFALTNEGMGLL